MEAACLGGEAITLFFSCEAHQILVLYTSQGTLETGEMLSSASLVICQLVNK